MDKKVLKTGTAVILCALALRLLSSSPLGTVIQNLDSARVGAAIVFLQTGRVVRDAPPPPVETVPEATTEPVPPPAQAVFSQEDSQLVKINNDSGYGVDVAAWLQQTLSWDLQQDSPSVLILHTHGTESYTQTEEYKETTAYRTQDTDYNVVSIGDRVAQLLEAGGIRVLHHRQMLDIPSYNGAYDAARQVIQEAMGQYPGIRLVLDIHRDAGEDASGNQIGYTVTTPRGEAAKLMLVMGTDSGGYTHPQWQENMSLAVKLQAQLEKLCPEICRPLSLRSHRYNQDLCAGSLLVEVGATGNTRQEALLAAEYLAQAVLALSGGTA